MTGVDLSLRGRQSTREWLKNLVATSTDYPLARYRVHEVVRSEAESSIEAGKCVLVVDVADSELSPHRCRADQLYYMRQAGRSVPAPHYFVDLLRHHASQATLEVVAIRIDVSMAALQPLRVSDTAIGILVENTSRTRVALDSEVLVSISGLHIDESAKWQPRNGENRRILPGVRSPRGIIGGLGIDDAFRKQDRTQSRQELIEILRGLTISVRVASDSFAGIEIIKRFDEVHVFVDGVPVDWTPPSSGPA